MGYKYCVTPKTVTGWGEAMGSFLANVLHLEGLRHVQFGCKQWKIFK